MAINHAEGQALSDGRIIVLSVHRRIKRLENGQAVMARIQHAVASATDRRDVSTKASAIVCQTAQFAAAADNASCSVKIAEPSSDRDLHGSAATPAHPLPARQDRPIQQAPVK